MANPGNVVASDPKRPSYWPKRMTVGLIVVGIVIVAGLAAWEIHHRSEENNKAAQAANAARLDSEQYNSLQTQMNSYAAAGQFAQAASMWVSYAQKTPSSAHKKLAWEQAGSMYMSASNFTQALQAYKTAATISKLNYTEAYGAATAAMRLKDKSEAIYYLKQSLLLMPANTLDAGSQRALFNQELTTMEQS